MPEYIEREATISEIDMAFKMFQEHDDIIELYSDARAAIIYAKPADVAPVRHGQWEWREKWDIDVPNHNSTLEYCGWYCSHCGIELGEYMTKNTNEKHYYDDDFSAPTINYCPNCGEKMDRMTDNG